MAIIVNGNGPWTKNDGDRPGLYARFVAAAIAAIKVGSRSKVGTIKALTGKGTAEAGKVYRVTRLREAEALFGEGNAEDVKYLIIGGASEVVISAYAVGTAETPTDYTAALAALETYEYHVFVGPAETDEFYLASDISAWIAEQKTITKNFVSVLADDEVEGNVTAVKANMTQFAEDETVVYIANGGIDAEGTVLKPQLYAFYIAGLIAGAGLAESITYKTVPFVEPSYRYNNLEVKDILAAGGLVTTIDGDDVRVEQGLTLGVKPFNKIRTVRAKQAMIDDIDRAVKKSYIGKITNHPDGQIAVINGVKVYLQTLANSSVISDVFTVELDPDYESVGDELYVRVSVRFLDSIEYIYLTVNVRQSDVQ